MPRHIRYVPLLVIGLLAVAACGSAGANSGGSGSGGPTLTITSPSDGSDVKLPINLTFTSSVPLGPPDSGMDHVHVFTDGHTDNYTVVPTTSFQIKNLSPGRHTIGVTLQHADHSPAGASAQVTVVVSGSGGGVTPGGSPTSTPQYVY
jgi:hypothetical protein